MTVGSDTGRDPAAATDRRPAGVGQESDLLEAVGARFAQLRKELQEYFAIKIAKLELSVRKTAVAVVSVALGVAAAIAFGVTAVVFTFSGLAGWLGEVTSKPYLGSLLAGLLGLLLVGIALVVMRAVLLKKAIGSKQGDQCD